MAGSATALAKAAPGALVTQRTPNLENVNQRLASGTGNIGHHDGIQKIYTPSATKPAFGHSSKPKNFIALNKKRAAQSKEKFRKTRADGFESAGQGMKPQDSTLLSPRGPSKQVSGTSSVAIGPMSPTREGKKVVRKQKKESQWQTGTTGGTFGGQKDSLNNTSKPGRRDSRERGKGPKQAYQSFNQTGRGGPKTSRPKNTS